MLVDLPHQGMDALPVGARQDTLDTLDTHYTHGRGKGAAQVQVAHTYNTYHTHLYCRHLTAATAAARK